MNDTVDLPDDRPHHAPTREDDGDDEIYRSMQSVKPSQIKEMAPVIPKSTVIKEKVMITSSSLGVIL